MPACAILHAGLGGTEAELAAGMTVSAVADCAADGPTAPPRIAYVAYPSSLTLRSANAIQTYATVRALRCLAPECDVLVPRFAFRPSRFAEVEATHLLRLPLNAGQHLIRSSLWSYA